VFWIGGVLFILSGLVSFLDTPLTPLLESVPTDVMQQVAGAFAALAMIVFAVGTRDGGSVVARRPVGMIALLIFALWPYVLQLTTLVPYETWSSLPWGLSLAMSLVPVVTGLVGVIEIVRIRAVPAPWHWLPAMAYLAIVGTVVFGSVAQELGWNNGEAFAPVIAIPYAIFLFSIFLAPFALGVTAIVLALVAGRRAA